MSPDPYRVEAVFAAALERAAAERPAYLDDACAGLMSDVNGSEQPEESNAVGPRNDAYIRDVAEKADVVVCAWGNGWMLP